MYTEKHVLINKMFTDGLKIVLSLSRKDSPLSGNSLTLP